MLIRSFLFRYRGKIRKIVERIHDNHDNSVERNKAIFEFYIWTLGYSIIDHYMDVA